jgi:hypothetical protein
VQVATTIHEAMHLGHIARLVAVRALDRNFGRPEPDACIVPFNGASGGSAERLTTPPAETPISDSGGCEHHGREREDTF